MGNTKSHKVLFSPVQRDSAKQMVTSSSLGMPQTKILSQVAASLESISNITLGGKQPFLTSFHAALENLFELGTLGCGNMKLIKEEEAWWQEERYLSRA